MTLRITRRDSEDLAFVLKCYFAGAISFDELKAWILHIAETEDSIPNSFWDILDIKSASDFNPIAAFGFYPSWEAPERIERAISGIALRRNPSVQIDDVSKEDAAKALEENPDVLVRFAETFPFLE